MRSRGVRGGIWLVVVLPVVALATTAGATSTASANASECAAPNVLLEEGKLEKARKEYLGVLASAPSSQCAVQGLQTLTQAASVEEAKQETEPE